MRWRQQPERGVSTERGGRFCIAFLSQFASLEVHLFSISCFFDGLK